MLLQIKKVSLTVHPNKVNDVVGGWGGGKDASLNLKPEGDLSPSL